MDGLNLNPTLGALEIGYAISTFLFGVTTVQAYLYYHHFADDPPKTKTLVTAVWLLELAHAISVSHGLYMETIIQYGEPEKLIKLPFGYDSCLFFSSGIALLAQCFFARRVWIVTESKFLPIICYVMASLRFIGSILLAVEAYQMVTLKEYQDKWEWLITFVLVDGACVDVIIASSLCYNLISHRSSVTVRTVRLLDQLIMWTIQTGLVTSLAAVAMTICFFTMKNNFVWLGVYMFLSRLFSNSLLASLNARSNLRKIGGFGMLDYSAGSAGTKPDHGIHFKTLHISGDSDTPSIAGQEPAQPEPGQTQV